MGCGPAAEHPGAGIHGRLAKEDDMTTYHHRVITKMIVGAAVVLSVGVGGTATARADANPAGTDPNPFGALTCGCQQTTPPGGPAMEGQLEQGIWAGLTATPANRSIR
jgi:hypothetical protein